MIVTFVKFLASNFSFSPKFLVPLSFMPPSFFISFLSMALSLAFFSIATTSVRVASTRFSIALTVLQSTHHSKEAKSTGVGCSHRHSLELAGLPH